MLMRPVLYTFQGVSDPSAKTPVQLAARPSVPPYPLPTLSIDNDDEVSYKCMPFMLPLSLLLNNEVEKSD